MPLETASSRFEAMQPNPAFPVMHYETATASLLYPQLYGHHRSVTPTTPQDLHPESILPILTLQEANDKANEIWSTQPDLSQLLHKITQPDYIPPTKASKKRQAKKAEAQQLLSMAYFKDKYESAKMLSKTSTQTQTADQTAIQDAAAQTAQINPSSRVPQISGPLNTADSSDQVSFSPSLISEGEEEEWKHTAQFAPDVGSNPSGALLFRRNRR
jgi:hypothetical protein